MRKFEDPVIEVMNFDIEDVISTSGGGETEPSMPAFVGPCL